MAKSKGIKTEHDPVEEWLKNNKSTTEVEVDASGNRIIHGQIIETETAEKGQLIIRVQPDDGADVVRCWVPKKISKDSAEDAFSVGKRVENMAVYSKFDRPAKGVPVLCLCEVQKSLTSTVRNDNLGNGRTHVRAVLYGDGD